MYKDVTIPTLEYFKPNTEKSTGAAVIIVPGGGYSVVVYNGEGVSTAKALAEKGIAAFVLKYRLPNDAIMVDKKIGPLQDAQQAIKLVRDNADKWGLDRNKLVLWAFQQADIWLLQQQLILKNLILIIKKTPVCVLIFKF